MLCEECHKEQAAVHVTRIVNDQRTEMYLCSDCARERGEVGFVTEPGFAFHNILAGLFEPESVVMSGPARGGTARCSNCGLSFGDFRRLGHLGCSECYAQFDRELEPLLKRIHRGVEHIGKAPRGGKNENRALKREIQQLGERLRHAVADEAYEEAARLRDEIKALERRIAGTGAADDATLRDRDS